MGGLATIAIGEGEERKLEDREFASTSLEVLARKGEEEPDRVDAPPLPATPHHELSAGYDAGANARTSFVHGPHASWAYAWPRVAISVGGGADFTGRNLAEKDERLVGGYGRASIEVRLPLGALTLRGGGGGRAGLLAQTIEPTATAVDTAKTESKTAFTFGPELFLAARLALDPRRTFFLDAGVIGNVLFLREEASLVGVAGLMGSGSLGARF
jgi:hypothetical protein